MNRHQPVLLQEVVESLLIQPGGIYVDGTVGGGGHAQAILERMQGQGLYIAIDRDEVTLARARERLKKFGPQVVFIHALFSQMRQELESRKIVSVDGILLDLGVSSFQLDDAERGFSFLKEGPLDMRMDKSSGEGLSAAEIIDQESEKKLEEIFKEFGEERFARRIARSITRARRAKPFLTTRDLAKHVEQVVPGRFRQPRARIHPATRIFQALRIVVNREMEHLFSFLTQDFSFLKPTGRIAIISFHSLEDRLVKHTFRNREDFRRVTRRPLVPGEKELCENPRSRSAKLRVVEKIWGEGTLKGKI